MASFSEEHICVVNIEIRSSRMSLEVAAQKFREYAAIGSAASSLEDSTLDGAKFLKMIREAGLLSKKLDAPKVDVIFMRVAKICKRINFGQFLEALTMVAEAKGISQEELLKRLEKADSTKAMAKTEYTRFHDDKSTYTGMHKR